jgi:hypothetical protein
LQPLVFVVVTVNKELVVIATELWLINAWSLIESIVVNDLENMIVVSILLVNKAFFKAVRQYVKSFISAFNKNNFELSKDILIF